MVLLVEWLNGVFSSCDQLANYYDLEKTKTMGDADMALRIRREVLTTTSPAGKPLRVRIGIHSGLASAGVIETLRRAYDL